MQVCVPKRAATPTNTHPSHEGRHCETTGDNWRQGLWLAKAFFETCVFRVRDLAFLRHCAIGTCHLLPKLFLQQLRRHSTHVVLCVELVLFSGCVIRFAFFLPLFLSCGGAQQGWTFRIFFLFFHFQFPPVLWFPCQFVTPRGCCLFLRKRRRPMTLVCTWGRCFHTVAFVEAP